MQQALVKAWPVFFGLGMIMIGNGLQGTLLGVRARLEDFSMLMTGLIMSSYYVGFFIGSLKIPEYVRNVGHIRVFAALASLASVTVLIHGIKVDPVTWAIVRAVSGFAFAGLFIVVESWLNDSATNETRGMMFGIYLVVTYVGMVLGQLLLNVASPSDIELFVITSILVTLALMPISLSVRPAPDVSVSEKIPFKHIWKTSPLGIFGVTLTGFATAAIFAIGPIFALEIGLSTSSVAAFMSAYIIGGVLLQMPVAWLSDRMDRRRIIVALFIASLSTVIILSAVIFGELSPYWIYGFMVILGGVTLTIYGQCISHVNDQLQPSQFVGSAATLLLMNGIGAMFGPLLVSSLMEVFGAAGFLVTLVLVFLAMSVFGLYRLSARPSVPMDEQGATIFTAVPASIMAVQSPDDIPEEDEQK